MAEMTESMKEKADKFDRERQHLQEKNKELMRSVDQLTSQLEETAGNTRRQEEELQDLRQNKELLSQVSMGHVCNNMFVTTLLHLSYVVGTTNCGHYSAC